MLRKLTNCTTKLFRLTCDVLNSDFKAMLVKTNLKITLKDYIVTNNV